MISSTIDYLVISDIHLGAEKTATSFIIKNLDEFFDNYRNDSRFAKLKAIFIAGDLFDRSLSMTSDAAWDILSWLGRLMRFCHRNKIILRILKGTPSHDREQSKLSTMMYEMMEKNGKSFDFKYVDTLYIEKHEGMGLSILYVPDEWNSSNDVTLKQVKELMKEEDLQQVDIAIMHGSFRYQLPGAPDTIPKHNEDEYLSLVKHYINIGHVHEFSVFERIVSQGSFDRLNHGTEVAKGGTVMSISPDGNSFDFIENKNAKVYKTIEIRHKDVDRSMEQVRKVIAKMPDDSHIRIKTMKDHPLYKAFEELKNHFPMINFTKIAKEDEKDQYELISNVVNLDSEYTPINIHKDNIVSLLTETILNKHQLSEIQRNILRVTLEQAKNQ